MARIIKLIKRMRWLIPAVMLLVCLTVKPMPLLAQSLHDQTTFGTGILETMQIAADNVSGGVVPDCGHYIPEERPDYLTQQIISFFTPNFISVDHNITVGARRPRPK